MPEEFWCQRRLQYQQLSELCDAIDQAITKLTIIGFSNNLFFICIQLLRGLR